MARSIGEWYGNASGRRNNRPGIDPDNDEPADRTPDTWFDDLQARRTPEERRVPRAVPSSHQEGSPSASRPRKTPVDRPSFRKNTDAATAGELAQAARALLAQQPGITTDHLTMLLRRHLGWPSLGAGQVREALGHKQGHNLSAKMAQDARVVMTQFPGIGPKKLAARLRQRGWRDATPDTVAVALRRSETTATPAPQRTGSAGKESPETEPRGKGRKQGRRREHGSRVQQMTPAQLRARRARDEAVLAMAARRGARLVAEVHAFRAGQPLAEPDVIARHLRRWGWPAITTDEVRQALRRRPDKVPPAPVVVPVRTEPGPHRTLDLPIRPNTPTCEACGRVISRLGICGCF